MLIRKLVCTGASALLLMGALLPVTATAQDERALDRINAKAQNKPLKSLARAAENARYDFYRPGPPREVPNYRGGPEPGFDAAGDAAAIASQTEIGLSSTTAVGIGFEGASNNDNGTQLGFLIAPPDTDGHVGPNHYVQMINLLTTIYDKSGNVVTASFPSNAFWSGIGGNCEPYNQGDPIVLYDDQRGRWLVSQFAFPDSLSSFSQCVAISETSDPTGAYNRYEFSFDGIGFNDYPKHGIVDGSITMIANLFQKRGGGPFAQFNFAGTYLGVMDKEAMYAGQSASLVGFNIGTGEFGFLAGDLDGSGSAPALFATAMSTGSAFDIWQIDVDWNTENASVNQIASIPVTPFDADLCGASREACIPQPDGGPALEAITDRLMHRLQIRDFGSYKTMVTAHTVDVGGGRAGIRWYEMRDSGSGWGLYQEGTYGPNDGIHRWMPSAAMNAGGDIGIGFLVSNGSNQYVSPAITGQTAANSGSGQFDSVEELCATGTGVQQGVNRSGDYSSTSVDEINGTFWHTNEVFITTGEFQWATYVCSFTLGDGGTNSPPTAGFTSSCTDLTCGFTDTSTDSDGTVTAWSWDFGDGATSTAQNPSHTYSTGGTFTVTLTVTDDLGATGSTSGTVTVVDTSNTAPTAAFTSSCTDATCSFTDTSTDSDGSVTAWSWNFGDGATSTAQNPSHTYTSSGTYSVTLQVTDDDGATDSTSNNVTVTVPNVPPTASFSSSCTDLTCDFTDGSSDPDGSIAAWSWDFGDGATSTAQNPSHTYAAAGTYNVSLTVTDNEGATGSDNATVSPTEPAAISLSANGFKVRGRQSVDLTWSGANSANVDIYRTGSSNLTVTTANDGFYNDNIGARGGATYTYQVCEAGTSTCSNTVTVVF